MLRIIIPSCHAYRDCWEPMRSLLDRYWPERAKEAILVTSGAGSTKIAFEKTWRLRFDAGWCPNLIEIIDSVWQKPDGFCPITHGDLLLLLQEDFFLTSPVNDLAVGLARQIMDDDPSVGCFRLSPCPGPLNPRVLGEIGGVTYGEVFSGEPYRISCQAAIWRPDYLRAALASARAPSAEWFEIDGSAHCRDWPERVLSVHRGPRPPIEYLCSAVRRGKWMRGAIEHCRREGIPLDTSMRPIEEA